MYEYVYEYTRLCTSAIFSCVCERASMYASNEHTTPNVYSSYIIANIIIFQLAITNPTDLKDVSIIPTFSNRNLYCYMNYFNNVCIELRINIYTGKCGRNVQHLQI